MSLARIISYYRRVKAWVQGSDAHERTLELLGAFLAQQVAIKQYVSSLHDVEFRVYSQWGDDGIIQWIISHLPSIPKRFIEFGVEDYSESNTRFLMVNNNWTGLVMDGSPENIYRLRRRKWFWRYGLTALPCFVTRDNVNSLIADWVANREIGLLHIDVDGNDYWLWDAIRCISPSICIMEYNAVFGSERAVTIPYSADFRRFDAHYSGQYFGASLAALTMLARARGYALIGTNSAGNNAYYVRTDLLNNDLRELGVAEAFTTPNFRDSRDRRRRLDYLSHDQRQSLIRGLPVLDVVSGRTEPF
ncbi:hypothetical protein EAH88_10455 [Rhodanobacter glycinis]|uniref:Uncharacterized protein n=1 Tax=Rhodanobacter glycinis TaxID=582702 RepID=A0A502C784_9GAMM|nr:hypothetical protein [Rhodanobacter glycinis]TPG08652.1 hypothetical protein EAH88_10455 [Rhodanobacter glycinis]